MNNQCPICDHISNISTFPFDTFWNDKIFKYIKCKKCKCTFVSPFPTNEDFIKMYDKENYHDVHYDQKNIFKYKKSLSILTEFSKNKKTLLDYGCGNGLFLSLSKLSTFTVNSWPTSNTSEGCLTLFQDISVI